MINLPGKEILRSEKFNDLFPGTKMERIQTFENSLAAHENRKPLEVSMRKTGPGFINLSENDLARNEPPYQAVHSYFKQLQHLTNEQTNEHYILDRMNSLYDDGEYEDKAYSRNYRSNVEDKYQAKELAKEEHLDSIYEDGLHNASNITNDTSPAVEEAKNVQEQNNGFEPTPEEHERLIDGSLERELDKVDEKGQDQGLSGSEDQQLDADHDYDYGYSL